MIAPDVDFRTADPARDSVDGVLTQAVATPQTAEGVAATLAWASARRQAVVIRGAGTKMAWGRRPRGIDLVIDMRGLRRVVSHQRGDLTVTVEAGMALGEVNRALGAHGQWLPIDPLFDGDATVGGVLAANDSGPLRHRYGTPRDLVIGVQLATPDGRLVKAGGQVVKNVAGYDLSRLVCGSFGSLAAVVSATFKITPVPAASATLHAGPLDPDLLVRLAGSIASSQLEPVAFECRAGSHAPGGAWSIACLLRFVSTPAALEPQIGAARALIAEEGVAVDVLSGEAERTLWDDHARSMRTGGPDAVVRASWLPNDLGRMLGTLRQGAEGGSIEMIGRLAVGAGTIRIEGDARRQAAVVDMLRRTDAAGNIVVAQSSRELREMVDPWGPLPNARLFAAVKRALDPDGLLGAGRGPV